MQRLAALLIIAVLMSCEWQDTASRLLVLNKCCKIQCKAIISENNEKEDCNRKACTLSKCCIGCCYILPEPVTISTVNNSSLIFYSFNAIDFSTFIADCFHPPEVC